MAEMSVAERDTFLREARIGVLATLDANGGPLAIPIWYEWDGARARMFSSVRSPKLARLRRDGRVCLTVAEPVGVPEAWVAIEGVATIEEETGFALAQRLAPRYYPVEQAERTLSRSAARFRRNRRAFACGFLPMQRDFTCRYPVQNQLRTYLADWGRVAQDWVTIVIEPRRIRSSAPE